MVSLVRGSHKQMRIFFFFKLSGWGLNIRWLLSPINKTQEVKLHNFITKPHFSLQFQFIQCSRHASCPWQARMVHSLAWSPTFSPALVWKSLGQFPEIKSTLEDRRFTTLRYSKKCVASPGGRAQRTIRGTLGRSRSLYSQGGHLFLFECVSPHVSHRGQWTFC